MPRLKHGAGEPPMSAAAVGSRIRRRHGTGESTPLTYQPAWARGPSRFVLEDNAWKHIAAPGSTTAG